jgi:hypothetical protein
MLAKLTSYSVQYENIIKTYKTIKMAVFWDVASFSLVDIDRRFRGAYCRHYQCDEPDDEGSKLL